VPPRPQGPLLLLVEAAAARLTACAALPRVDGGFWGELHLARASKVAAAQLVAGAGRADAVLLRTLDQARIAASAELLGVMARALDSQRPVHRHARAIRPPDRQLPGIAAPRGQSADPGRADARGGDAVGGASPMPLVRTHAGSAAAPASQAKARASAAALEVTKGCIQLHGGIGYTDECGIGLFLKKAMAGAAWLGTASWHRGRYNELAPASDRDDEAPELIVGGEQPIRRDELRRWIADNFPPAWRFPSNRLSLREAHDWLVRTVQEARGGRRRTGPGNTAAWV
jgi:alkylation response protein AidB-like acyl-CoA dehydrogenase